MEKFEGVIGKTYEESTPWWPEIKQPPAGSPNIVVILLDDTGFAHLGCYGSSISTPNMDKLAEEGLQFTNFHTTALCSPTRACLLTGRNHHTVGMRAVSNMRSGFPHLRGRVTKHAANIAELLRDEGYGTYCVGKWHLTPMEETSGAGPFDHWPTQSGFDRFYGFLQGETDQFHPELTLDNHHIERPADKEDYHLSEDLVENACKFINDSKSIYPEQPFFLYLTFGATHAPHQAPEEFLQKYRGKFDEGWDQIRTEWFMKQKELGVIPDDTVLADRNPGVEEWDSLSENQKNFACRLQEAFAAMLDHTDAQIGSLLKYLDDMNLKENTIVMLLSDNGASQEGGPTGLMDEMKYFNMVPEDVDKAVEKLDDIGGPKSHTNYPWGWAQAGNCPMRWYKQTTHGGGVRDPFIIRWPKVIKDKGGKRDQFHHITDVMPSILEILGLEAPKIFNGIEQLEVAGTSFAYLLNSESEPTRKKVQYFEMFGHRAIWSDGWKAVSRHEFRQDYDDEEWELFHLDRDVSETNNLSEAEPERLKEMIQMWWEEAEKHGVLPLDDRTLELFRSSTGKGSPHAKRTYIYRHPISHMPAGVAANMGNRSFVIEADIKRKEKENGVLLAIGGSNVGLSLFIKDERLMFDYNIFYDHKILESKITVPEGEVKVGVYLEREDPAGEVTLLINGEQVGKMEIPFVIRLLGSTGMDIGRDSLSPVSEKYSAPFPFEGVINQVAVHLPERGNTLEETFLAMRSELGME